MVCLEMPGILRRALTTWFAMIQNLKIQQQEHRKVIPIFRLLSWLGCKPFPPPAFRFTNSQCLTWRDPHYSALHLDNLVIVVFEFISVVRISMLILSEKSSKNDHGCGVLVWGFLWGFFWCLFCLFVLYFCGFFVFLFFLAVFEVMLCKTVHWTDGMHSWSLHVTAWLLQTKGLMQHLLKWMELVPWAWWAAERWDGRRQPGRGWSMLCIPCALGQPGIHTLAPCDIRWKELVVKEMKIKERRG